MPILRDTPQKLGQQTLTDGPTFSDSQLLVWCIMALREMQGDYIRLLLLPSYAKLLKINSGSPKATSYEFKSEWSAAVLLYLNATVF